MTIIIPPKDLAKQLDVSLRTLQRWHARRIGPARTKVGNFIGYRPEALQEWLKQNETKPIGGK